jgi:putative ABC transport system permease protein
MLAKSRGFTVAVIVIIGSCIGANTALFNALDQVSLRLLPVRKARELVGIHFLYQTPRGAVADGIFHYPLYEAFRDQTDVFSGLAAFSYDDLRLRVDREVRRIQGLAVSGNYFSVLGVTPALGRMFSSEQEPDTASHPVVIISDRFRRRQFGPRENVIGKQIVVNDQSLTIVGVTPAGFAGSVVGWLADLYVPLGTYVGMKHDNIHRDNWTWLHFLGRLKPGVSREQVQASLCVVAKRLQAAGLDNMNDNLLVSDGSRGWIAWESREFHRPLILFMIAAAFILVIASLNIANMQLSRALARRKEIAIRRTLGAGGWRVVRQLLTESLLLALAGGAFGVVLAVWLDRALCILVSRIGSFGMTPGLDWRVLLFAAGISLFVGLVLGLTPALEMVRRNMTPALKDSPGLAELPVGRWSPHHLLVVFQVAIGVVVLVCAGLFVRSAIALNRIDPGYDTSRLLAVSMEGHTYNRPELRRAMEDLYERIKGLPGVEASCLSGSIPLSERGSVRGVKDIDGVEIPEEKRFSLSYDVVSPEYFRTLNMPLLAGRLFSAEDSLHSSRVVVINDTMARQFWPDQNPVGRSLAFRSKEGGLRMTVIGVVRASKIRSIIEEPKPVAYLSLSQDTQFTPGILIRTAGSPYPLIPMIRAEVAALRLDEDWHIRTVADRVADRLFPQHAFAIILNAFSLVALLLCAAGIYAVVTQAVSWRTRDIGIRLALGAEAGQVVASVLVKGVLPVVIGLGLGLGASAVVMRILQSHLSDLRKWDKFFLHGVSVWDPWILVGMPLLLLVVAVAACYLPARRAAKIDPMVALRCE